MIWEYRAKPLIEEGVETIPQGSTFKVKSLEWKRKEPKQHGCRLRDSPPSLEIVR